MTNKEIANIFRLLSKLMEIHGEDDFKARSYSIAAYNIEKCTPLIDMDEAEIALQKGIGKAIHARIQELLNTGNLQVLEDLLACTPEGILPMLRLKGIGGKKIGILWRELGIESLDQLQSACEDNRIAPLKGFGKKTQQNIIDAIAYIKDNTSKFMYAQVEAEATFLEEKVKAVISTGLASLTGDIRRRSILVERIELVAAVNGEADVEKIRAIDHLTTTVIGDTIEGSTPLGTPLLVYLRDNEQFYKTLFETTGAEEHLKKLEIPEAPASEEAIYAANNFPYILPELREGFIEFKKAANGGIPHLLQENDIKGVVHCHSTYSDGVHSIEKMAKACIEKGYEYLVISDHSQSAFYAGGLLPDDIKRQHEEVNRLNEQLAPFKIFKSIEADILNDGQLDYPNAILETFDLVIGSIHSNQRMDIQKATQRLLTAVANPYLTILGHPSGRLLLRRDGYPIDYEALIAACAQHQVAIEVNANPRRLDLDWRWLPAAFEKGVYTSINPDAHSINGIDDIHYGVLAARKGYATTEMTINAWPLQRFENYLVERKAAMGI